MRHSLYSNNMRTFPSDKNRSTFSRDRPNKKTFSKGKKNKFFPSLEDSVNEILTLYEDSPNVRAEIIGNLEIYILNRTIARDLKSSKSEKKLTEEFTNYLKQLKIQKGKV